MIAFRLDVGGSRSLSSTSGGRERAAPPTLDARCTVLVKDRTVEALEKAGSRKSGRLESLRQLEAVLRAVQNIIYGYSLCKSHELCR